MIWSPLVAGKKSVRVYQKINSIANVLISESNQEIYVGNGLLAGKMGGVLFFAYLWRLTNNPKYLSTTIDYLTRLCKEDVVSENFCFGLTGTSWALNHLVNQDLVNLEAGFNSSEIDQIIFAHGHNNLQNKNYDFIHAGLGSAVYFLERYPDEFSSNCLQAIVDELYTTANRDSNYFNWFYFDRSQNKVTDNYNLGLSHGVPSIITILCQTYFKNISKEKSLQMIEGAVNWLLKQQLKDNSLSHFSHSVGPSAPLVPARLAWCYGDLGIAVALWHAGVITLNKNWKSKSIELLTHATKRTNLLENGVLDCCFCHGTVGIAHIFNRFFQITKMKIFQEAAVFWLDKTIDMIRIEENKDNTRYWKNDNTLGNLGIIDGLAGVGLALISLISHIEPKWDRCLLLS